MTSLIIFLIGLGLGWIYRDMRDHYRETVKRLNKLEEDEKPRTGPTLGSYRHVDEVNPVVSKKARGRVVNPKSPQRVEWEARQQIEEENKRVRVSPK